jgi:cytochrome c-type biogenesis protein CcmH/NrfG
VFQLVQLAAFGILVLATIGEVTAIIALSNQSAGGNTRFWVFWSVILLTVLVAAPPLVALGKFQYDAMQGTTRRPAAHVHDKPDGEEAHGRHQ